MSLDRSTECLKLLILAFLSHDFLEQLELLEKVLEYLAAVLYLLL
jgi:hypothetical protein